MRREGARRDKKMRSNKASCLSSRNKTRRNKNKIDSKHKHMEKRQKKQADKAKKQRELQERRRTCPPPRAMPPWRSKRRSRVWS